VVVAFRGRPRTRSFGLDTAGAITSNDQFDLADGASMAITVAWLEDRQGVSPRGPLHPDVVVGEPGAAIDRALEWLAREAAAPAP
jgi:C-terminal processing protease CtpA/Prc